MSRNRRAAHPRRPRPRQNVHSSTALLLLLHGVVGVHPLLAQERPDSTAVPPYPTLATSREVAVASAGAAALIGSFLIPIDVRDVPASGRSRGRGRYGRGKL